MVREPNICDGCARLRRRRNPEGETSADLWIPYCEAFPDRIPDAIYFEGFDHRNPYPGDSGIRFVLQDEEMLRLYEERIGAR